MEIQEITFPKETRMKVQGRTWEDLTEEEREAIMEKNRNMKELTWEELTEEQKKQVLMTPNLEEEMREYDEECRRNGYIP